MFIPLDNPRNGDLPAETRQLRISPSIRKQVMISDRKRNEPQVLLTISTSPRVQLCNDEGADFGRARNGGLTPRDADGVHL